MNTKTKSFYGYIRHVAHGVHSSRVALLLLVILPAITFSNISGDYSFSALMDYFLLFCGSVAALIIVSNLRWFRLLKVPLLCLVTLYYIGLYGLIGYYVVMRNSFDPTFVDFGFDIKSFANLIGWKKVILIGISALSAYVVVFTVLVKQINHWKHLVHNWEWARACVVLAVFIISIFQVPDVYGHYVDKAILDSDKVVITPRDTEYETDSNENVIILQLESTNAMAMAGYLSYEGKKYDGFYMPHMKSVASDGTFFPLFFSNQQQTVRAQIAALCGIPGNTGARFSKNMEDVPIQCLPDKLHESGYDTIFIKSSDNPRFMDTSYMMSNVGFSEQHYSDIMKEDDKNWGWGYDDCTFYKRAFKFLNEKHSDKKKKFVYMEVGSNHADFHPKEGYEFTHMLDGKENHLARYINSALQQDYCVSEFYENFQTYAPENTHLFILGDHPWGLQTGWAKYEGHAENFFVPFAYVPPRNRKHEFESQKIVDDYYYSQSDIVPTIFELLGKKKYKNSFGYELKKPTLVAGIIPVRQASYERCHVLHELYGGGTTAVVKGLDKYTYVHKDRKIYHGDLSKDLLEEERVLLEEDASFSDFIDEYSCKRFSIKLREDEHT